MMQIITYPILVHAFLAITMLFFWKKDEIQRKISVYGSLFSLAVAIYLFVFVWNKGTIAIQMGNWEAPFGISLVADTLAVTLVLLTNIVGFAVSLFSSKGIVASRVKFGYFPIFHFMIMGLSGAFLTGDIFNLYVWFEIIIISSFVLLTIGGKKEQIEGAVKYFTLNMLASIVFLTAIALLYGVTGTLNMAHLSEIIPNLEDTALIESIAFIFFLAFSVKAGVFPLYTWLPAAYHTPPAAVSSVFGGLLTKLGLYAIFRLFTLVFPLEIFNFGWIEVVAMLTIFSGAVGAYVQKDMIKAFSYLIICHIGFMLAGFGINTEIAIMGAVAYLIHDIIVKANLFLIGGISHRITGSTQLKNMGGLMKSYPRLAILFAIPLFSLIGIPPLSGFWPKISLFGSAFSENQIALLVMLIFGSFMTLVVVAKIWLEVFSKNKPSLPKLKQFKYFDEFNKLEKRTLIIPIVFLSIISLYIGLGAEHITILVTRISEELTNTRSYYDAVFNIQNITK